MITVGITNVLITVALALLAYVIISYKWKRRHLEKLAAQLPGPSALPIFGNILEFRGSPEDILNKLLSFGKQYTSLSHIWFGHHLIIYVPELDDVQIILNSSKALNKSYIYRFLAAAVGNGLVTAPANVWHRHRRVIGPTFNTKILKQFVPVFNKYSKALVDKLRPHTNGLQFNIGKYIHSTLLDIICETTFGADEWTPHKTKSEFGDALIRIVDIIHMRTFRMWLHFDFIFNQLYGSQFKQALQQFLRLPSVMIENKRKEYELKKEKESEENRGSRKTKSKGFIEILLDLVESGAEFTEEDVRDETVTMISAGHDTSAQAISFCLLMLAIHQDFQKNVYEEMVGIFDNSDREATTEDLKQMTYTEMVIKETLRLYPSAPLFLREAEEDIKLTNHTLPAGCSILISPKAIHMDPKVYTNPEQFNPENFTPERTAMRHKCSYLPFSAGPRNCIGQVYAMMTMKITIAGLIRNYIFSADIKMDDIKLKSDVLLRSAIGFPVKIIARKQLQQCG